MTCPNCGARNPPDAAWCTQCFARFVADDPLPAGVPAAAGTPRDSAPEGDGPTSGRDVREHDGVVEWRCRSCQSWNPLLVGSCTVCGSARSGFGTDATGAPPRHQAGGEIVGASLLLPGLGHLLRGDVGSGLARALLAVLWAGGGLAMTLSAQGPAGRRPGLVLLGGAVLLWVASAIDASRLAQGRTGQLLDTRRLGGLVVLVTGVLIATVLLSTPTAT